MRGNKCREMVLIACCCFAAATAFPDTVPPGTQPLDDSLQSLSTKKGRSEADEDRLDSIAHFSAGRMLQQRQQTKQALREYERALRYDAAAGPVLRELIPLVFTANRTDEGLRYLIKYADQNSADPEILQQAAELLAESGDWKGAIKLDERALEQVKSDKASAQQVILDLQLGRLYALDQQYGKAATQIEPVLKALANPSKFDLDAKNQKSLLGDGGATYALLGAVFLEAKRFDLARKAFEEFNNITPDAGALAYNMARVDLSDGRAQEALDGLQKYFDAQAKKSDAESITAKIGGGGAVPGNTVGGKAAEGDDAQAAIGKGVAPYALLAKVLTELKQDDRLVSKLEAMHKAQPKNAMLADYLGKQYLEIGNLGHAQELIESAHEMQPTLQSYRWLAEIYRKTNQPEKLLTLYAQLIEQNDSLAPAADEIKSLVGDENLSTALIARAAHEYAAANEKDYNSLRAAAMIAAEAKRWKDAETLFNLATKAQPKATGDLLLVWGLALFMDEKYDDAVKVFQRGIDDDNSTDSKASFDFYLAGALEMAGKTDEALKAAQAATEAQPKNPSMASRPAWILYHAKRYDEAMKAYQALLDQWDDDFTTEGARDVVREARSALSNLYVMKHDMPQAVELLEQVLDEYPDDAGANNDLGYLWADENQHLHRSERMIQLAVDAEPDNFAYRDSLGWVLHRMGRDDEALVQLKKAVEPEKPEGEVLDHLGEVEAALGHKDEAQAVWKQSAEAFQKAGEAEKMKAVQKKAANQQK
jgi:tetratricopeptide (TPR) repeat protein